MPPLPSTASTSVVWDARREPGPEREAAVLALARADWEALGARFFDVEDALGGIAHLATGEVEHSDSVSVRFGVLDHDAESTSLLAASWEEADAVIVALVAAGLSPAAILMRVPASAQQQLEDRVAAIERWIGRQDVRG